MMSRLRTDQRGFTLTELLVAITVFSIISVGFYQMLMSGSRGSDTARDVARVSEEARAGFNRMIRDTREGSNLVSATPTQYNVTIDFDGDGDVSPVTENPNGDGDYENLTFSYNAGAATITLNGEVLMEGVEAVAGEDVFSYESNFLEYDWNADGVATWQELDAASTHGVTGVGNNNGILDGSEITFISTVRYAFSVTSGDRTSEFVSEAQLRNRR